MGNPSLTGSSAGLMPALPASSLDNRCSCFGRLGSGASGGVTELLRFASIARGDCGDSTQGIGRPLRSCRISRSANAGWGHNMGCRWRQLQRPLRLHSGHGWIDARRSCYGAFLRPLCRYGCLQSLLLQMTCRLPLSSLVVLSDGIACAASAADTDATC